MNLNSYKLELLICIFKKIFIFRSLFIKIRKNKSIIIIFISKKQIFLKKNFEEPKFEMKENIFLKKLKKIIVYITTK